MLHPRLVELRDATGETIVVGKIHGTQVINLDVVESEKAVRYACVAALITAKQQILSTWQKSEAD